MKHQHKTPVIDEVALIKSIENVSTYCRRVATDREVVLIVGNTGAGKSTFVNYLAGCELYEAKVPGVLGQAVLARDPIMEIGHGFQSYTAYPQLHTDNTTGLSYCDCPGFLDNRGPEFDIVNGYAIKAIVDVACSVKGIVVMVNYHGLLADRGRSLRETLSNLSQLLGGGHALIRQHLESIKIIVTHCPLKHSRVNLKTLQQHFRTQQNQDLSGFLARQVLFYDPFDREPALKRGALSRAAIGEMLGQLPGIPSKGDFGRAVSQASQVALYDLVNHLTDQVREQFEAQQFDRVQALTEGLNRLLILEFPLIDEAVLRLTATLLGRVKGLESDDAAMSTLETIRDTIPCCREMAEASLQVIQARLDLKAVEETAIADAKTATAEAEQVEIQAQAEQRESEHARALVEQATQNADVLAQSYIRLIDQLKTQIQVERQRGPRVIDGGTFHHGRPRRGGGAFKKLLGGLFTGVLTGITTGNPAMGLASGLRSTAQSFLGNSVPLPAINYSPQRTENTQTTSYHSSHYNPQYTETHTTSHYNPQYTETTTIQNTDASTQNVYSDSHDVTNIDLTTASSNEAAAENGNTRSWAAGVFSDAASGAVSGGIAGLATGGPIGAGIGAGAGAVGNAIGGQVKEYLSKP